MTKDLDDLARSDVFDSRDVDARITELENDIARREEERSEEQERIIEEERQAGETIGGPETLGLILEEDPELAEWKAELDTLQAFKDEVGSREWKYGMPFIADSYFKEYAEQLADDIGAINRNMTWPMNHIDWDAAADALKMDYSSVELDDYEFWYRS